MKPVKNISTAFFEIGSYYSFGGTIFRCERIRRCRDLPCLHSRCTHLEIFDNNGKGWCGIEKDFKRVPEEDLR